MPLAKRAFIDIGFETKTFDLVDNVKNNISALKEDVVISKTAVPVFTKVKDKPAKTMPIITLNGNNVLTLRGPVSASSMNTLKIQLLKMSDKLPDSSHIYLVLDTPGGSVGAGLEFIDAAKAIPQKVHTITLFAASMGFQIVQNLNNRYITPSGTLMSHRAKVGGLAGELPGELIVRLNHLLRMLKRMDQIAADRIGMTLKDYRELIRDEYWVDGFEAVKDQMADREVLLKCSSQLLNGTETIKVESFFGSATLKFSKCPLLTSPLSSAYNFNTKDERSQKSFTRFVEEYYKGRESYVNKYIKNNKYQNFVK